MKKITAIICLAVLMLAAFSSCEKVPDFVPIEKDSIETLNWTSGKRKDINREEYFVPFADAYNAVTGNGAYIDREAEWSVIAVCREEDDNNSLYMISYLGEDTFNVSINGKTGSETGDTRYSVVNPDLAAFAREKFLTLEKSTVKASVKFVISAGIPDENGTARAEDEVLNVSEQTLDASELDVPTVSEAVIQAVMVERFTDDVKLSENGLRVKGLSGYKNGVNQDGDEINVCFWNVYLNGEKLSETTVETTPLSDGDEIVVIYEIIDPEE